MRGWGIVLALALAGGCLKKPPAATVDAELPEARAEVSTVDPVRILIEGAESLDPTPRATALALLISTTDDLDTWGNRALYDPDPWVQRRGALALSDRLPDDAARALLEAYVARDNIDPYVRGLVGVRLVDIASEATRQGIRDAWKAPRPSWERAPLALSAALHGDTDALAPLSEALARGDVPLELGFVMDLGASGLTELLPALIEGAGKVEEELVLPYAVARIGLGDPSAEGLLRKALTAPDDETRLEALDYLSHMHHPEARALLKRARNQGPDLVRHYASLALAARTADARPFQDAIAMPEREIRQLAVRFAAEASQDPEGGRRVARAVERIVHQGLVDDDAEVRTEALRAVARLGMQDAVDAQLRTNLSDDYLAIRLEAAGALLLAKK